MTFNSLALNNNSTTPMVNYQTTQNERNKMMRTGGIIQKTGGEPYETHKSVSPRVVNTSTEFKCRYKELTWNVKPQGMVPVQPQVGPQLNSKSRAKVSKRSSEPNAGIEKRGKKGSVVVANG